MSSNAALLREACLDGSDSRYSSSSADELTMASLSDRQAQGLQALGLLYLSPYRYQMAQMQEKITMKINQEMSHASSKAAAAAAAASSSQSSSSLSSTTALALSASSSSSSSSESASARASNAWKHDIVDMTELEYSIKVHLISSSSVPL
jgi:hypothetical protein